jgi:hypothetical protein
MTSRAKVRQYIVHMWETKTRQSNPAEPQPGHQLFVGPHASLNIKRRLVILDNRNDAQTDWQRCVYIVHMWYEDRAKGPVEPQLGALMLFLQGTACELTPEQNAGPP